MLNIAVTKNMFRERFRHESPVEQIRNNAERYLHEKNFLPPDESLPDFETCCDALIDSALALDNFIKEHEVQTMVFLDRGARNIQGGIRAAADALGISLPTMKFIDNHLLARKDGRVSSWKADVETPILLVDEIALTGESLELTKIFLEEEFPGQAIYTAALTRLESAKNHVDFGAQTRTGFHLGYWYMSQHAPREVEETLEGVNEWPSDYLISPVARNPKNAWFGERNPNRNERETWTKLHPLIQRFVRERAESLTR